MIVHVEMHEREKHAHAVDGYLRLRKKVFHDQLGWNVTAVDGRERDALDDAPCTYALSLTADGKVDAGIRLIPTTQTTLLDMAFDGLVPDACSFRSPTIWELSRYCVDHDLAGGRLPAGLGLSTLQLALANFHYARRNGITHFIAVTEERVFELTNLFDLGAELLARETIDGCRVVCTLFSIDDRTMRLAERFRPLAARADGRTMPAPPPSGRDATSHVPGPARSRSGRETSAARRQSPQA